MPAFNQLGEVVGVHSAAQNESLSQKVERDVPPESLKYRDMACVETIIDPSRSSRESHAITLDFNKVVYKCQYLGKFINILDRQTGNVQTVELPEMVFNVQLSKDQHDLFFGSDGDFYIYDLNSLSQKTVFKDANPKYGSPEANQLNKNVCVVECANGLFGFNLLEGGESALLLDPVAELGGPTDAIRFYHGDGKPMALISAGQKLVIYDLKAHSFSELHNGAEVNSVKAISESRDGKYFLVGDRGKVMFLDKENIQFDGTKEIEVAQIYEGKKITEQIFQVEESLDSKHLIVRATNSIMIINLETGKEVKRIPGGRQFFQSPETGDLSVNTDSGIEMWSFNYGNGHESKKVRIKNGELLNDQQWYGNSIKIEDKTEEGTFWLFVKNHEAALLESRKEFKWGKQRIYFDIPLEQLEKMSSLVEQAAIKSRVAISYKFVDTDLSKNSQLTLDRKVTRFVTNFATIEDAKNFYEALRQIPGYNEIPSDSIPEDFAHSLDHKAFYAQDYKEYRGLDVQNIFNSLIGFIKNEDGSYSRENIEGGIETLSEGEYRDRLAKADISGLMKKAWEGTPV